MKVEWSSLCIEERIDGQHPPPLPIGALCAAWPTYGTWLLRREAGFSEVGSIRGSVCSQPGEGLGGLWK